MKTIYNLCAFLFVIATTVGSCKKNVISPDNNPPTGPAGSIGSFSVNIVSRVAESATISWTVPSKPLGTIVRYKIYIGLNNVATNLTDTNFIITNLLSNQSYSGRIVAYTAVTDSSSITFTLPPFTSPPGPTGLTNETTTALLFTSQELNAAGNSSLSLTCLNPDLSLRWKKTDLGNSALPNAFLSNGKVYLSAGFYQGGGTPTVYTTLYCFDAATGTLIWSQIYNSQTINIGSVKSDTILSSRNANQINGIAAYNANNGSLYWNSIIPDAFGPVNMIVEGNALYYFTALNQTAPIRLISFNTLTHNQNWSTAPTSVFISSVSPITYTLDKIAFRTGNSLGGNTIFAINKNNGSVSWTKTSYLGIPTSSNDNFFVVNATQNIGPAELLALNSSSGTISWQFAFPGSTYVDGEPFLSGENLYVIASNYPDTYLYSVKSNSGLQNYRKKIFTPINKLQNVVVGQNIYTLNRVNPINSNTPSLSKLYVFDAGTGNPKDSTTISAIGIGLIGIAGSSGNLVFSH